MTPVGQTEIGSEKDKPLLGTTEAALRVSSNGKHTKWRRSDRGHSIRAHRPDC